MQPDRERRRSRPFGSRSAIRLGSALETFHRSGTAATIKGRVFEYTVAVGRNNENVQDLSNRKSQRSVAEALSRPAAGKNASS